MQKFTAKVENSIFGNIPTADEIRAKRREEADSSFIGKFSKTAARWLNGVEDKPEPKKTQDKANPKSNAPKPQDQPKNTADEKNKSEQKTPAAPPSTSAQLNKTLKAKPAPTPPVSATVEKPEEKPQPPGMFKKLFMPKTYHQELNQYHRDRQARRHEITGGIKTKQAIRKMR